MPASALGAALLGAALLGAALLEVSLLAPAESPESLPQAAVMVSADTTAVAAAILLMVRIVGNLSSASAGVPVLCVWFVVVVSQDGSDR
jgi:hypothetical protein